MTDEAAIDLSKYDQSLLMRLRSEAHIASAKAFARAVFRSHPQPDALLSAFAEAFEEEMTDWKRRAGASKISEELDDLFVKMAKGHADGFIAAPDQESNDQT